MKNIKEVAPIPANQQTLINDALLNESFRRLLLDPKANREKISKELDRMKIYFASATDKENALDIIVSVDWLQFKNLEDLLGRDKLQPLMN